MKKLQFLKAGDYMKTITRAKYLDRIIELNGTPDIKIITGIRRSGKSKLMQAYIAYLKSNFENINIIFIDFMDLAYEKNQGITFLTRLCGRTLSGRQNELPVCRRGSDVSQV